jgi:hypothetical protein
MEWGVGSFLDFDADKTFDEEPDSTTYEGYFFGGDGGAGRVGMVREQRLPG